MTTIVCCQKCYDKLLNLNEWTAKFWVELCKYYVHFRGVLNLHEEKNLWAAQHMQALEQMGYIATADGEAVGVRVNGYKVVNNDNLGCVETFCVGRDEHLEFDC